ncbi:hypothetical protein [Cellulomonas sp. ICMP 17802]|uniref:hypothetical protein n=1 Tax=Cellulomonas sp. ICMP 17802 TaxID=3239199 RepID=UPI00351AB1FB
MSPDEHREPNFFEWHHSTRSFMVLQLVVSVVVTGLVVVTLVAAPDQTERVLVGLVVFAIADALWCFEAITKPFIRRETEGETRPEPQAAGGS